MKNTIERDVLEAIQSFAFSSYGCDDMDELVYEQVGTALARHITGYLTEVPPCASPVNVYVVIQEDRHCDTDAQVFTHETDAVQYAYGCVAGELDSDDLEINPDARLTDSMKRDGWVLYLPYGCEGDNVRVVKRALG